MKTVFNALLFSILLVPSVIFGQSTIKGTVTDEANAMPLPGVNVLVKGTTQGTSSDFNGLYSLDNVNNGDTIVFSYLGFITQEIIYTGQITIDVAMVEDAAQLDEIVLIGYGSTSNVITRSSCLSRLNMEWVTSNDTKLKFYCIIQIKIKHWI